MANEKTTTAAAPTLYKVGYTYISPEGFIRTSAIVVEAENAEKAKKDAAERLAATTQRHIKIGKTTKYE